MHDAKAVASHSLKERSDLWESFKELREGRNSFVHEGRAVLGKRQVPVTVQKAEQLLQAAQAIVDWVESWLPENARRPQFDLATQFTFSKTVASVRVPNTM